jgi:phosphoenolpyruvate synthase/pyruvate phosphate dikinase
MSLVRRFGDVGAADLELVGGKGANLGELVRAGMNVPPGFVLTTSAYRAALATLDLSWLAERDAAGLRSRSAAAREWIEAAALPEAVVEATLSAYRDLGSPTVAVRSSATA